MGGNCPWKTVGGRNCGWRGEEGEIRVGEGVTKAEKEHCMSHCIFCDMSQVFSQYYHT